LVLATHMYNSTASRVYAPLTTPQAMRSELILGASALEISGGHALAGNAEEFEEAPHSNAGVYWARHTDAGRRLVIVEWPASMRGSP
jgi:hypothetical protein